MRVQLGCSLGGEGHLVPLANVAKAFERAGHEVDRTAAERIAVEMAVLPTLDELVGRFF